MHLLIHVVSYIAIIAHERNRTVLIEFGRYIRALLVLLGPSFKYSGVSKIVYFYNIRRYWLIRLWGRNIRFFIFCLPFQKVTNYINDSKLFQKDNVFHSSRSKFPVVWFFLNLYRSCVHRIFIQNFLSITYISSVKSLC